MGAISIPLHKQLESAVLVESNAEAVEYANQNIAQNNLQSSFTAHCSPAEHANQYITSDTTVIFDPPRAGLHSDTIAHTLAVKPKDIIYLSCNLSTHARDIQILSASYEVKLLKLFNFFPQTPHIEGLCVLSLK